MSTKGLLGPTILDVNHCAAHCEKAFSLVLSKITKGVLLMTNLDLPRMNYCESICQRCLLLVRAKDRGSKVII